MSLVMLLNSAGASAAAMSYAGGSPRLPVPSECHAAHAERATRTGSDQRGVETSREQMER